MRYLAATLLLAISQAAHTMDILTVCIDYHCERQQQVPLEQQDWHQLLEPFSRPAANADSERENIRESIAQFEQLVGSRTPTHNDQPENKGEDEIGQLDCIAESRNTQHYLQWLERKNQLKWHTVGDRVKRAPSFIDVHWGVAIIETDSGNDYIVDSWYKANGKPPAIQPLEQWLRKAPTPD